jgi:hypothetical protein
VWLGLAEHKILSGKLPSTAVWSMLLIRSSEVTQLGQVVWVSFRNKNPSSSVLPFYFLIYEHSRTQPTLMPASKFICNGFVSCSFRKSQFLSYFMCFIIQQPSLMKQSDVNASRTAVPSCKNVKPEMFHNHQSYRIIGEVIYVYSGQCWTILSSYLWWDFGCVPPGFGLGDEFPPNIV